MSIFSRPKSPVIPRPGGLAGMCPPSALSKRCASWHGSDFSEQWNASCSMKSATKSCCKVPNSLCSVSLTACCESYFNFLLLFFELTKFLVTLGWLSAVSSWVFLTCLGEDQQTFYSSKCILDHFSPCSQSYSWIYLFSDNKCCIIVGCQIDTVLDTRHIIYSFCN